MEEGYGSIEVENLLSNSEDRNENNHETRQTSLFQTISNIIKLCIGSGVLALPYAVNEAGLVCHVVGLSLVTLWNIYSTDRLIKCREYMQEFRYYMKRAESFSSADDSYSSKTSTESQRASLHQSEEHVTLHQNMSSESVEDANTGTLGKVSLFAFGKVGLHAIDSVMMILMFGIIIAYEDAILGFVQATPATTGSKNLDAILMLLIIIPLASLSDFSSIAKVAALGTVVLFIIFISIGYYGLNENGLQGFESISDQNLWPSSFSAISSWYGIVVCKFFITIKKKFYPNHHQPNLTQRSLFLSSYSFVYYFSWLWFCTVYLQYTRCNEASKSNFESHEYISMDCFHDICCHG